MDEINLDGEYYGNFDTYFKIEGDKMEVSCYLSNVDQVLKYNYKRIKNEFISTENENDRFEIFSYTKDSIIMKESTEMIIEIKKYTILHKFIQLLGYKI
jgi:hypothetical protein